MTVRKGLGYKDRPPHEMTEETKMFIDELDADIGSFELSPCKFCGGDELVAVTVGGHNCYGEVMCMSCGVRVQAGYTAQDAVDRWNSDATGYKLPEPDGWHKCPECGCVVGYTELYGGGWSIMMDDYQIPFNHCPQCGVAVEVSN